MFFIMGVSQGQKQLEYHQTVICGVCGAYGRYEVFMTYMYLSFFFIPLFKWNKQYLVRTSCCGSVYSLDPEIGRAIERGEQIEITEDALVLQSSGKTAAQQGAGGSKRCPDCGYEADPEFEYCPKCGRRLDV
jgi:hypothetical protein